MGKYNYNKLKCVWIKRDADVDKCGETFSPIYFLRDLVYNKLLGKNRKRM